MMAHATKDAAPNTINLSSEHLLTLDGPGHFTAMMILAAEIDGALGICASGKWAIWPCFKYNIFHGISGFAARFHF